MVADGYQMLGDVLDKNKLKVRRVLPDWLQNPDFVSIDLTDHQMPIDDLAGECLVDWKNTKKP